MDGVYLIPPSTSKVDTLNDLHNFMTGFIQITVETAETIKEIAKAHRAMQDQLCDGQPRPIFLKVLDNPYK